MIKRPLKLAIVSTHPVQYYAPVFRGLARRAELDVRVFYTWSQAASGAIHDPGFGQSFAWDVPLLDGYQHEFVANVAKRPGLHGFWGVRTPSLASRIEAFGADALLVYGWNLASHLSILHAFTGRVPVFFRGDSTLIDSNGGWRALARRVALRAIYARVDVALAVGANSRDYFRWCGFDEADVEFAPHSVDTRRFAADDDARRAAAGTWRAKLGIPAAMRVFGFAGKFIDKKDPLLLIEAFLESGTNSHLVLFGSGPLEETLRARGRHPRIHFLPFQNQSELPVAYRLIDVFVLPSRGPGETWGLVLNEAMACGCAVVASSRVGAARDLVRPRETGWTFEAGHRDGLRAVLGEAASLASEALDRMRARARELSRDWSTEACVQRMTEIITRRAAAWGRGRRAPSFSAVTDSGADS